jgi:phenylacetate-CoA ligase
MQLGPYPTDAKIDYLLKFQPQGLVVTPAYLTRITTGLEERGLEPSVAMTNLKAIFIAAESYTLEWAIRMQERWGCGLSEWYGTMQGGVNAAVSCEAGVVHNGARAGLHLMEHRIFMEILRPGGDEPVKPGEEGEMVKTTLYREAFPVVRFRTGDRVRLMPGPCDCGRPFAMIEAGTISRFDDMFKVKGQNVWPESVDAVLFADPRIDEYMGTVSVDEKGLERVEVKFELRPTVLLSAADVSELVASLERELKRRTGVNMAVENVPLHTVPRFQFKVRRWTDKRSKDREVVRYTTD